MEKKRIITIAGRPASGKSTTAKGVTAHLGYQHFSSGDLFRALAGELGIDLMQANLTAEENSELDHAVDGRLQELAQTEDQLVIDSRTAWHWMPQSYKVFLDLDLLIGAERILENMDDSRLESEHVHRDPHEYAAVLKQRLDSEARRYKKLYDINPYDLNNYDLVIDTSQHNPKECVDLIVEGFHTWLDGQHEH